MTDSCNALPPVPVVSKRVHGIVYELSAEKSALPLLVPLRVAALVPYVSARLRTFAEGYGSSAGAKASGLENHVSRHVPFRPGCKDPLDCGALVLVVCLSSHHRCDRTLPSIQKSCLRASPMTTKAMSSSTDRTTSKVHVISSRPRFRRCRRMDIANGA